MSRGTSREVGPESNSRAHCSTPDAEYLTTTTSDSTRRPAFVIATYTLPVSSAADTIAASGKPAAAPYEAIHSRSLCASSGPPLKKIRARQEWNFIVRELPEGTRRSQGPWSLLSRNGPKTSQPESELQCLVGVTEGLNPVIRGT